MPVENVDLKVEHGAVLNTGIFATVALYLTSLATFLTTITGSLPGELDPKWAVILTASTGIAGTLAQLFTGLAKVKFGAVKAELMKGNAVLPQVLDYFDGEEMPELFEEPTDTNVEPPIEPQD